jgi:hypothetical protein
MATPDDQIQDLIDGVLERSRVQLRADLDGLLRNVAEASATQQEEAAKTARTTAEAAAASLVAEAISAERASAAERLQAAVEEAERSANEIHQAALTALQSDLKDVENALGATKAQAERDLADARAHARSTVAAVSTSMLEGVKAIDDAQSLTEVLDGFLDHAARNTPRVAMLLLTDEKLRGWKWQGFLGPATTVEFAVTDTHLVSRAAREGTIQTSSNVAGSDAVLTPANDGRTSVAIPVIIDGRVVAVLYGDDDGEEPAGLPGAWPQLLEVLARHASRVLEAMTARRMPDLVRASAAERAKRSDAEDRPALLGQAS